jgi:hypothetical protein
MEVVVVQERRKWFRLELELTETDLLADLDRGLLSWDLEAREVA